MLQKGANSSINLRTTTKLPAGVGFFLALFVFCLLIPSSWEIGGIRLDTTRLFALCVVAPLMLSLLAQKAGRLYPIDVLIVLHALWIMVSMMANHGFEEIPISGMLMIELLSGFLVGRILIRNCAAFKRLFQLLLVVMMVFIPFALFEMVTERAILQEWFGSLLGSAHPDIYHAPRLGFYRAQTTMSHPILWGVFCSIAVANVVAIWSIQRPRGIFFLGVTLVATFSSLSSGALLGALVQIFLMTWGWFTKGAWKSLSLGFSFIWVFLSVASNRGPFVLFVTYLTLSPATGWGRIHIWRYGIDDALANPIFGIGIHDWTRPFWLPPSIDNFWLVMMMRHGFVGFGLLALAILWHFWMVATAKGLSAYEQRLRKGYLIGLTGLIFSLATVHFWGPPYLLFFAYLGAGVWFYSRKDSSESGERLDLVSSTHERVALPYSRTHLRLAKSESVDNAGSRAPITGRVALPYSRNNSGSSKRERVTEAASRFSRE